jgi:hypothetical protein
MYRQHQGFSDRPLKAVSPLPFAPHVKLEPHLAQAGENRRQKLGDIFAHVFLRLAPAIN